jgi:hypothetical protein
VGINTIEFGDGAGNINTYTNSPVMHNYGAPVQYVVIPTTTTPAGCSNSATITAEIKLVPTVSITSTSYCSNRVEFQAQNNMDATNAVLKSFYWLINGDSITNVGYSNVAINLETGMYCATFGSMNSLGCLYEYDFEYFVDALLDVDDFTLSNIITPNHDGINDFFYVDDVFHDCKPFSIEFFNRGDKVFSPCPQMTRLLEVMIAAVQS